jgi:membrane associated rhomboid family serine protease
LYFNNIVFYIILLTVIISISAFDNERLKQKFLFNPYKVKSNNELYRLVSHVFIHADWSHLVFNMFSFYFLGSFLYSSWLVSFGKGPATIHMLVIYLLGGIFASLLLFVKHKDNPYYNSLGASGAVSAVVFATIIWNPNMELILFLIPFPIKAYIFGPAYLLFEYFAMRRGNSNIAHEAHLSGAIFGVVYVILLEPDKLVQLIELIF